MSRNSLKSNEFIYLDFIRVIPGLANNGKGMGLFQQGSDRVRDPWRYPEISLVVDEIPKGTHLSPDSIHCRTREHDDAITPMIAPMIMIT